MGISTNCWYVLYVKTRHEKKINEILQNNGVDTFLPLIKTVRKWSDRKKTISIPIFPSYIFFKVENTRQFYEALATKGVFSCIRIKNNYVSVSNEEIQKIKRLINVGSITSISVENGNVVKGDMREFKYGPLAGLKCEVLNVNNPNKIAVRVDSIKHCIVVTLSYSYLSEFSYPQLK